MSVLVEFSQSRSRLHLDHGVSFYIGDRQSAACGPLSRGKCVLESAMGTCRLWVSAHRGAGVGIHQILQFFAGLERSNPFGRNFHACARFRITPHTRLPLARAEASKTPDFDLIPTAKSANHTGQNSLDDHLRVFLRHFHSARDFFDQLSLGHVYRSSLSPKIHRFFDSHRGRRGKVESGVRGTSELLGTDGVNSAGIGC